MNGIMREAILKHCKKYKYSKQYIDYWIHNAFCTICGNYSAAPHHIRTQGAGHGDKAENLLALCSTHHTEIHTIGVMSFADKYSQNKIFTALSERDALNVFVYRRQE